MNLDLKPFRYDNTSIEQGMTITGTEQALNEKSDPAITHWMPLPELPENE